MTNCLVLEGRKLALFVTTFPADESHNFVLVQVFKVVKPAPGVGVGGGWGGLFRGNLLFWTGLENPEGTASRKHHWLDN